MTARFRFSVWTAHLIRSMILAFIFAVLITSCTVFEDHPDRPDGDWEVSTRSVGEALIFEVSPDQPLNAVIDGLGRVRGPRGAFTRRGTMTIQPTAADFAADLGVAPAGDGVDITFEGTDLTKPLTLAFSAVAKPTADSLPVFMHQRDEGEWEILPARVDRQGRMVLSTGAFSPQLPGWLDPETWAQGLGDFGASLLGGRTSPLDCSGPPSWFILNPVHSDLVHVCAKISHTSEGTEVAEVQIKSNRGVTIEVRVPGDPVYVWVEGQPWPARQKIGAQGRYDPNRYVLLPAGKTMTVGYPRGYGSTTDQFVVDSGTYNAVRDSGQRAILDFALGHTMGELGFLYSQFKCTTGYSWSEIGMDFEAQDLRSFLSCMTSEVTSQLADDANFRSAVAREFAGNGASVEQIADAGKVVGKVGWVATFWPTVQIGVGGLLDVLKNAAGDSSNSLILFRRIPAHPSQQTTHSPTPTSTTTNLGSPSLLIHGSCTSAEGELTSTSGGFTPGARYEIAVWRPDGNRYPLGVYEHGTVASDGTIPWRWPCAGDPSGTYITQVSEPATGLRTASIPFKIGSAPPTPPPSPMTLPETTGGAANTWTNPANAGGTQGPSILAFTTVQISCRLTGFVVTNGNPWWYRIASSPWTNSYYVSADAFYNNGATSGSLVGTPWVDEAVTIC